MSPGFRTSMFELFVGDVVYYVTNQQTLAKDKIKAIVRVQEKGKGAHVYLLFNGLQKRESDLFLSIKRAKAFFERNQIEVNIPGNLENT